jgi:hypothetical protein
MKSKVRLTLALRSSGDTDPIDTEAVTFQYLLETYNVPVPAKLPYALDVFENVNSPAAEESGQ